MHLHLPKPLHGWREFVGEVGIIVLGVLIALSAEGMLSARHWAHKREEVRANLITEMRDDNGVVASGLLARSRCADEVLERLADAISRRADRQVIAAIAGNYPFLPGTFDNQAFTVAQSSEALLHGNDDDLVQWGGIYGYLPYLGQVQQREWESVGVLQSWSKRPGQLTDAEEQRAFEAIGLTRQANAITRKAAASLLTVMHQRFGLTPPRADQIALYHRYKEQYGACAIDAGKIDLSSLRSSETKLLNKRAR